MQSWNAIFFLFFLFVMGGGGDFGSGSGSKFNCAARVGSGQTISGTGRVRASVLSPCRPLLGMHPTRPAYNATSFSAFTSVDGAEEKGYNSLSPLDESVAVYLCSPTAIGWKAKAAHPSKLCRTTSAFAERAYSSAGQTASALHSMVILQVLQAKLLRWRLRRSAGPWPI